MFNNDVTYDKKWETEENKMWLKKLDEKYFDRSYASPDCPVGWAKEVFELLEMFNNTLGIEHNTSTLRAYYPQGSFKDWFIIDPFKSAWNTFVRQFFKPKPEYQSKTYNTTEKLQKVVSSFLHPFGYGFRCVRVKHVNPILNKILKPKLRLSQVKEKYGSLTLYIDVEPAFENWVQTEIKKCEIRLSLKGCYYPIENLYDSKTEKNVGTEYSPDMVEVEKGISSYDGKHYTKVTRTIYRNIMKDMGINLEPIAIKAMLKATAKEKNET